VRRAGPIEQYISAAPTRVQRRLRAVRAAIRAGAPGTDETISYGMPFYSYKGESGIRGRLCYFGYRNTDVRFYMRPRDLEPHMDRVAPHLTTKSALRFPVDGPIPISLIEDLVREAARRHAAADSRPRAKGPSGGRSRS
jgi:uncharacterized protein YdhG (YjbR/CyaY superfamily)